jgi:hypothetical protein
MILNQEETKIIQKRRDQEALNSKKVRYAMLIVEITDKWTKWGHENGEGLTFGTFVNCFLADEHIPDEFLERMKAIYEAVKSMLNMADEQANLLRK